LTEIRGKTLVTKTERFKRGENPLNDRKYRKTKRKKGMTPDEILMYPKKKEKEKGLLCLQP